MKTLVPWLSIRLGLRSKWIPARLLKEVYASMQTSTRPFLEDHTPSGKQENDCEYSTYFCVSLCLLLWDSSEISGVSCGHWTHNSKGIWSQWGTGLEGVMCNTSVKFLNSQHLVEVTAGGGGEHRSLTSTCLQEAVGGPWQIESGVGLYMVLL